MHVHGVQHMHIMIYYNNGGTCHAMHRYISILVKGYHALCSSKSATSKEFSTGSAGYGMDMEPECMRVRTYIVYAYVHDP